MTDERRSHGEAAGRTRTISIGPGKGPGSVSRFGGVREIELTRQNKALMKFLDARGRQTETVSLEEARIRLGVTKQGLARCPHGVEDCKQLPDRPAAGGSVFGRPGRVLCGPA